MKIYVVLKTEGDDGFNWTETMEAYTKKEDAEKAKQKLDDFVEEARKVNQLIDAASGEFQEIMWGRAEKQFSLEQCEKFNFPDSFLDENDWGLNAENFLKYCHNEKYKCKKRLLKYSDEELTKFFHYYQSSLDDPYFTIQEVELHDDYDEKGVKV